jgi:DNA-binding CsgD family transcriptional regulator
MQLLPNLRLECDDLFWSQMILQWLGYCLGDWQPPQPMVLVVDEPWGTVFNYAEIIGSQTSIVLTRNSLREYWEDVYLALRPNALLAGEEVGPDALCNALKVVNPGQHLKLTPAYTVELTARELEVLHHLAGIKTNKQIAKDINLAEGTVRNHVSEIIRKLGLCGREEAMLHYWGIAEIAKRLRW